MTQDDLNDASRLGMLGLPVKPGDLFSDLQPDAQPPGRETTGSIITEREYLSALAAIQTLESADGATRQMMRDAAEECFRRGPGLWEGEDA